MLKKFLDTRFAKDIFLSFLDGVGSIFGSFAPGPRPRYKDFGDDAKALRGDWQAIGDDMRTVMDTINARMEKCSNRMGTVGERLNHVLEELEKEYEKEV